MLRLSQRTVLSLSLTLTCLGATRATPVAPPRLEAIRFWSFGDVTRIAIQTQGNYFLTTDAIAKPSRLYFDLTGLRPPLSAHRGPQTIQVDDKRLKQIRIAEVSPGKTRVVLDLVGPVDVVSSQLVNPDRLMIELRPKRALLPPFTVARNRAPSPSEVAPHPLPAAPSSGISAFYQPTERMPVETAATPPLAQLNLTDPPPVPVPARLPAPSRKAPLLTNPAALTGLRPLAINREGKVSGAAAPALRARNNDQSLVRVFGLKLGKVVIDAGHGGHDTGTIGPDGLEEKELVLDVALRLGRLITQRLGAEVIYTRPDDTFIPLEQRTRIANNEKADLFLSIHANSSPEPSATGVETYFFNFTNDRHSVDLATRENAASASSISDLGDLLHRAVLQAKLEESREFAQQVQSALWASSVKVNNRSRDRGVRQAPFVVLIGATMPSILAEIGFVSNPHDEHALRTGETRQKIAEALYKGIAQYANSLSHLQMARVGAE